MSASAATIIPEPQSRRQLGDDGLVIFWRAGSEPGRRQGLACVLSMCPNPGCACRLVYADGFVIDEAVTAVSSDEDGLHVAMRADATPLRVTLVEEMIAIVDPDSGETTAHPDLPEDSDPALVDWLGSEMDEELLEVLHRYRARVTGDAPEGPRTDIDVASPDSTDPIRKSRTPWNVSAGRAYRLAGRPTCGGLFSRSCMLGCSERNIYRPTSATAASLSRSKRRTITDTITTASTFFRATVDRSEPPRRSPAPAADQRRLSARPRTSNSARARRPRWLPRPCPGLPRSWPRWLSAWILCSWLRWLPVWRRAGSTHARWLRIRPPSGRRRRDLMAHDPAAERVPAGPKEAPLSVPSYNRCCCPKSSAPCRRWRRLASSCPRSSARRS